MHHSLAFIDGLGGPELMMIMFIILLLFGADKMPGLARGIGKSVREFKKAASGVEDEVRRAMEEIPEPEKPQPKSFPPAPPPAGAIQQAPPGQPPEPPAAG